MPKIFAYVGKGGVGKSTLAVETAYLLSQKGKTVIIGLDQQHNHDDIIKAQGYNIDTVCLTPKINEFVAFVIENIAQISAYKDSAVYIASDFISMINLGEMYHQVKDVYEYIVIDFPPNTSALNMVKFPDLMKNMVFKAVTIKERVKRMIGKESVLLDRVEYMSMLTTELADAFHNIYWIPLGIPTELGFLETTRSYATITELGFKIFTVVCNMVWQLPDQECETCLAMVFAHDKWLAEYNKFFNAKDLDVHQIPHSFMADEIREKIEEYLAQVN